MNGSYSQCGEDRIVAFLLAAMGTNLATMRYIDVGCHDPCRLNNTYLFYESGAQGLALDANPSKALRFKQERGRDIVVNAMVDQQPSAGAPFYVMNPDTLSTGSEVEARRLVESGAASLQQVVTVPGVTPQQLLAQFFDGQAPDLVSIDIEGADEPVARSFLAGANPPLVVIVETLVYVASGLGRKKTEILSLFDRHGYLHYADTYVNSVFVRRDAFEARFNKASPS